MKAQEALIANLTREMSSRGISQSGLARQAKMAPARINEIVRGKVSPSLETIDEIAAALGLVAADLLAAPSDTVAV